MRTDFVAWKWLPFPLEEKDGKQCFYLCFLIKTVSASLSVLCGDAACEVIKKNVIWSRDWNNGVGMLGLPEC